MEVHEVTIKTRTAEIPCKWFFCGEHAPLLIEIHGGGFCNGDCTSDDVLNKDICLAAKVNVLSIGYRIAPAFQYPVAIDDCIEATQHILESSEFSFDKNNVFITGHSAGGNLATGVCLALGGKKVFRGQLLNYAWLNLGMKQGKRKKPLYSIPTIVLNGFLKKYIPEKNRRSELKATPLNADKPLLRSLPDTLFITSGRDSLKYDSIAYNNLLQEVGVRTSMFEIKGAIHGFIEMVPSGGIDNCFWLSKKMRAKQKSYYSEALKLITEFITAKIRTSTDEKCEFENYQLEGSYDKSH